MSAPQPIAVGEPTGRFPRILPVGSRHVGSLDTGKIVNQSENDYMAETTIVDRPSALLTVVTR